MATVKIKFRASSVSHKEGCLYYQVIHNRLARQIGTCYRLHPSEWDAGLSEVVLTAGKERNAYLQSLKDKVTEDLQRLKGIVEALTRQGKEYTSENVVAAYRESSAENSFFMFMDGVILQLEQLGKTRTSETYTSALNSFKRFREDRDVPLSGISPDMMVAYETWLKGNDVSMNTISFYNRILKAVYNRAVEKDLVVQRYPFKHVYTGVGKTIKRAVPLKVMRRIKEMDLASAPLWEYARDMFLFSFYTRGMSFVDMAYLKKKDLFGGILSYRRKKTGQQLYVKWEPCMQEIVERYGCTNSPYLLSAIRRPGEGDERKQYINEAHRINKYLKAIGTKLDLSVPLTLYVARHTWASIARSKNVPISVISEGMGHDSEATTRIYLASLDTASINKANSLILKSI